MGCNYPHLLRRDIVRNGINKNYAVKGQGPEKGHQIPSTAENRQQYPSTPPGGGVETSSCPKSVTAM